ncbi:hypothetical protein [Streptomyces sp. WAC06614]|uniref:hypothetical protein n=1 Tax=Streptomyces sp. WAC06614 TaxID=2487416 RepID=UPI00163CBE38|nr:hypothetical protein [Streptomyces sp. WAC06614]
MPRVAVEGAEVVVRLSPAEALAARRRRVRVPAAAVRRVYVETAWWRALRGTPVRGGSSPGRSIGVRRTPRGEDFTVVHGLGPVLCLELGAGAPFGLLALSVPDPEETARTLRPALSLEPEPEPDPEPAAPEPPPVRRPRLQHEGGTVDDHGREPGSPSRTGTGAQPPADAARVARARAGRERDD